VAGGNPGGGGRGARLSGRTFRGVGVSSQAAAAVGVAALAVAAAPLALTWQQVVAVASWAVGIGSLLVGTGCPRLLGTTPNSSPASGNCKASDFNATERSPQTLSYRCRGSSLCGHSYLSCLRRAGRTLRSRPPSASCWPTSGWLPGAGWMLTCSSGRSRRRLIGPWIPNSEHVSNRAGSWSTGTGIEAGCTCGPWLPWPWVRCLTCGACSTPWPPR